MIRSSVDLPEPLGPSSAVSDPFGHLQAHIVEGGEVTEALGDVLYVDPHFDSFLLAPRRVMPSSTISDMTASSVAAA